MGEIIDKVKGKIKQVEGDITGDKKLHAEGVADEIKGKIKGAAEDVKHAIKDLTKQSADWDLRLALKEKALRSKFTAMEVALSNAQAASSQLTASIAKLG